MNNPSNFNIPNHVAIIMDGNARWAKKNNLSTIKGHKKGVENIKDIAKLSLKYGIKYLTLYAFSAENWQRSKYEVNNLFNLLDNYLDNDIQYLHNNNIRLNIIGDLDNIDENIKEKIYRIEKDTINNDSLILTIAISYGSRQEIQYCIKNIVNDILANKSTIDDISLDYISNNMYSNIPDPDLLIRTGSEKRLSNFLLWQIAYTELSFIDQYWPEFSEDDFFNCVQEYNNRNRRYGKR
ncbi:MAG: di-trans,poly-cis-decaprenylcistransferase [Rickettsiales bacterium]|jgi:undecaprenyl diphosphate synthase|nr:di-trans,poly-cis-decaprenylcistransferase [Rickettsiales bacterium]|tara:strand:- start:3748 stop:4461 length:714 start_codon:yes stop_codon:yes gene_type:complete